MDRGRVHTGGALPRPRDGGRRVDGPYSIIRFYFDLRVEEGMDDGWMMDG